MYVPFTAIFSAVFHTGLSELQPQALPAASFNISEYFALIVIQLFDAQLVLEIGESFQNIRANADKVLDTADKAVNTALKATGVVKGSRLSLSA